MRLVVGTMEIDVDLDSRRVTWLGEPLSPDAIRAVELDAAVTEARLYALRCALMLARRDRG
jgi:hypothetical protein